MMTDDQLGYRAARIRDVTGKAMEEAELWAALIGDAPEVSESGEVIVRDFGGVELGRVPESVLGDDS